MAKDPAFLFYPGDWLGGTITFSRSHKGAYMDLLMVQFNSGHMELQDIKDVLGSDFDSMWEKKLRAKFKIDSKGKFFNEKLENEIVKRRKYTKSREENLKTKKNTKPHMNAHMDNHMENENENTIENINTNTNREKIENLVPKMVQVFKTQFPNYPVDKEKDSESCLEIAYKIADSNKWVRQSVYNVKMLETIKFWEQIVQFGKGDNWFSSRSITDYNREWQRLIQKINSNNGKISNGITKNSTKHNSRSAGILSVLADAERVEQAFRDARRTGDMGKPI